MRQADGDAACGRISEHLYDPIRRTQWPAGCQSCAGIDRETLDASISEVWFNTVRLNPRDAALPAWSRYLALPDERARPEEAIRHRGALQRQ